MTARATNAAFALAALGLAGWGVAIWVGVMVHWIGVILGSIIGTIVVLELSERDHRADLIQRGLAEYCATDGRLAFKGECGK